MVQNATPSLSKGGRPPGFDREAVVSAAMRAFWSKGFSKTTLDDLESATGADRSTLYNSFGGKEGLYRSATAAYVASAEAELFDQLYSGSAGIADILDFVDRLDTVLGSGDYPDGCLIVNDMAASFDPEATSRYLELLENGLKTALERASAAGEIDPARAHDRCQFLTAAVIGVNLVNRNALDNTGAIGLIASMRSEISTWARSTDMGSGREAS
jgi:TetR/AcrR family transcriptional repressor of nem operon